MNIHPTIEKVLAGSGYARAGNSMEAIASVTTVGQTVEVRFNFIEQVTAITNAIDTVTGESVGWTLSRAYVYSTDGETWSAPISLSALQLLAFDPNEKLYLGVNYTGTGTAATQIDVWFLQFEFTFDLAGTSGRMFLDEQRIYMDMREILEQIINQISPTYDERVHFQFAWGTGSKCVPDGTRPNVFAHDVTAVETTRSSSSRQWAIGCRLGIRRRCSKQHRHFELFRGIIKERFGERGHEFRYDLSINGNWYLGVKLGDIGFWGMRSFADTEITGTDISSQDLSCGCTWWETSLSFSILSTFTRKLN